jgi:hypothetical protein
MTAARSRSREERESPPAGLRGEIGLGSLDHVSDLDVTFGVEPRRDGDDAAVRAIAGLDGDGASLPSQQRRHREGEDVRDQRLSSGCDAASNGLGRTTNCWSLAMLQAAVISAPALPPAAASSSDSVRTWALTAGVLLAAAAFDAGVRMHRCAGHSA